MVGILFAGSKLTHLQRQVCSHIVNAIKIESARFRDEWEISLCSITTATIAQQQQPLQQQPDTYYFEMLSLVLALSGSDVGCLHLSQQLGLIKDILGLLHTGKYRGPT